MDHPTHQTRQKRFVEKRKNSNPILKYTFDGKFSPTTPPDDDDDTTPKTTKSNHDNSEPEQSSESKYSGPSPTASLAASLRLIANTMLRMELAQLEMVKKREIARLEAQKQEAELEDDMTRMMLQTQSHVASFVFQNSSSRKRKSSNHDDNSRTSQ